MDSIRKELNFFCEKQAGSPVKVMQPVLFWAGAEMRVLLRKDVEPSLRPSHDGSCDKRTVPLSHTELWKHGKWYQDDEYWKVLYWAKPIKLDVPEELTRRPRMGTL